MGQVHPRGPNVVRLTQRGAGKNCECGAPYFDEHEIASDARLTQLFPNQEIIQTVQAANMAMKKVYKNILPVFIFLIIMASVVPNVLFRVLPEGEGAMICRTTKVCPVLNISLEDSDSGCNDGCQIKCCRTQKSARVRECSPEFEKRNEYTKKVQSGKSVEFGEKCCLPETSNRNQHLDNCKDTVVEMSGNVKNESSAALALRIALMPVVFLLFIIGPLGLLIKNQNDVKKAILDTFEPWKAKGIRMEYRRPQKHSAGALYFHLPHMQQYQPQNIQPQQLTMAGQPTQLVQSYQAQQPGQIYQQPRQPGQPVQVIQMVQQPGGVFYSQAPPAVVIAQQSAKEPKQ